MTDNGEFFRAKKRKFKEIIFFVHFYGGNKKVLNRHIELVNSLGFDAFAFDLKKPKKTIDIPVTSDFHLGWKHIYADQIESLLNEVPGEKIVFSFSNPSASAIEAIRRRHCQDIVALVCDSGPSVSVVKSAFRLYSKETKQSLPRRLITSGLMSLFWSPELHYDVGKDLGEFTEGFPILSIRGWKDSLIPPVEIDKVFDGHNNIQWRKLSIPEADHLTGLRDFPDEYIPGVEKFLLSYANNLIDTDKPSKVGSKQL